MKATIRKIYYTILLLIFAAGASFAQGPKAEGSVSGTLLDEQGKPMMFASTSLLNAKDSSLVKGVISNEQGVFTFDHIKDGQYIVKATPIGYEKAVTKPFSIDKGSEAVTLPKMVLQPSTKSLSTVNITAAKPLIERKLDRTVMNVEGSVLAAGNSAMDILERAPGVSVDKDDNISLKGKQGVTVMLNDKLTYLTSAQLAQLLRSTDGNTISAIEIITNPSAKYDAAGNSGIINIKLKKNKQVGTNGSITLGAGYGEYGKDNETIQLNHKEGNLNIFGSFSHNDNKRGQDIDIKRGVTDTAGNHTYFNQFSPFKESDHNNSFRLGADYDLSSKNTIGFLINGHFHGEEDANDNTTFIGPNYTQVDSSLRTISRIHQTDNNFAVNLNDTWKIDTAGQQISADLDYSRFRNNADARYMTDFFLPGNSTPYNSAFLGNITPTNIDIKTAKVDYTNPLTKSVKMDLGFKLSDVKADNNLMQSVVQNGNYTSANHFVYDEKIDAGYVNFSKEYKNTSVQLGLRGEYTRSSAVGDSMNVVKSIPRHYFNLFPTFFVNHTFNDKNEMSFSYGRRIDRPQYDNLNPFVYRLDPYTYQKGNPYLTPQYTNNFELSYTYNKSLNVTLGYSHTTDVIAELPGTDPATKVSFVTNGNLEEQNSYNVNIYTPYTITKWWEGNVNATGFYLAFKSNGLEGRNLDAGRAAYQFRTTQTFTPVKGWKAELTGNYQSALTYALFYVKPQYSVDGGISHSFANKKANIKLSMSDMFNTRRNDVTSNYADNDLDIRQKRETRITRLTLTYNFGNNKIKARQHQTGADELNQRAKGGN